MEHVTVTGIGLLLLLYAASIILLALSYLTVQNRPPGWNHVTPGAYWVAAIISLPFSVLIAWVWAFVGSARADAASQMFIAWWLSFAFGLGGFWSFFWIWRLKRLGLRWRGQFVALMHSGQDVHVNMKDMTVFKRDFIGMMTFTFKDGTRLPIDLSASRGGELFEKILVVNGLAEDVPEH
jgi:hypothetical protein